MSGQAKKLIFRIPSIEVCMMILKSITVGQTKVIIHDDSILQDKQKIEQKKEELNKIALGILKKRT